MTLTAPDVQYLQTAIADRSGNVVSDRQSYLLEARLTPVAKEIGLEDVHGLVNELRRRPGSALHAKVAEAMTINETSFFRDLQPFDALRDVILPELIEARSERRRLSVWSAASASGQEPYSLALLIRNSFPQLDNWNVSVLATDLSEEMIRRTEEGVYSQFEVNRGLPASLLVRNFERDGLNWRAKPELRNMIRTRQMNLAEDWLPAVKHDVVFLRNVLIYFTPQMKEHILSLVHKSMQPDGVLFLGGGETILQLDVPFERVSAGNAVCFRPVC